MVKLYIPQSALSFESVCSADHFNESPSFIIQTGTAKGFQRLFRSPHRTISYMVLFLLYLGVIFANEASNRRLSEDTNIIGNKPFKACYNKWKKLHLW